MLPFRYSRLFEFELYSPIGASYSAAKAIATAPNAAASIVLRSEVRGRDEPVATTSNGEPPPESAFDFCSVAVDFGDGDGDGEALCTGGNALVENVVGTVVSTEIPLEEIVVASVDVV